MEIETVSEYIAQCEQLQRERDKGTILFFRGVNTIYPEAHIPSIYYKPDNFIEKEHLIFREILARFPE